MNLLDDLRWRGLLHSVTDEATARAALQGSIRAYIGFDPTATSLHVGSLMQIVTLMRLQRAGHTPIALVGGGTGMIGDPSGKSAERKLLSDADVRRNADALEAQLRRFLRTDGPNGAIFLNNLDWLAQVSLIAFLRDVGKHFSVNAMVQRDSVRTRLEQRDQGISYTEFSYMLLQAYDFLVLFRDHGCVAQIGGSDQWGNIVSGSDLIGRLLGHEDGSFPSPGKPFGITTPLVTTRSGQKFGKTEAGAIWLDPALTSPYRFYQFWINVEDADAGKYLRTFTFLDQATVESIEQAHEAAPHLRKAQKALAWEMTVLVHGEEAAREAVAASEILFGGGDVRALGLGTLQQLEAEIPFTERTLPDGATVQAVLVGPGLAFQSNGEAKRALQAGSVHVSGVKLGADLQAPLTSELLLHGRYAFVRVGKKQFFLVALQPSPASGPEATGA